MWKGGRDIRQLYAGDGRGGRIDTALCRNTELRSGYTRIYLRLNRLYGLYGLYRFYRLYIYHRLLRGIEEVSHLREIRSRHPLVETLAPHRSVGGKTIGK